jgi:hypothetical protein
MKGNRWAIRNGALEKLAKAAKRTETALESRNATEYKHRQSQT